MEAVLQKFSGGAVDPVQVLDALLDLGLPSNDAVVAALKLWEFVGRRPGRAVITASQLAGYARRNDSRTARNWIAAYEAVGLIKVFDRDPRRGSYDVHLFDPLEAGRAQAVRPPAEDQIELDFEPDEPAAIPIGAETDARRFPPGGNACAPDARGMRAACAPISAQLETDKFSSPDASAEFVKKIERNRRRIAAEKSSDRHGACFARENLNLTLTSLQPESNSNLKPLSAAPTARDAPALARFEVLEIVKGLGKVSNPEWIEEQNARLIGWLEDAFPGLRRAVSRRIAEAVTSGRIPEAKFRDAADAATSGPRNPRAYFIGAAQNIFRQHCVPWHETISPG